MERSEGSERRQPSAGPTGIERSPGSVRLPTPIVFTSGHSSGAQSPHLASTFCDLSLHSHSSSCRLIGVGDKGVPESCQQEAAVCVCAAGPTSRKCLGTPWLTVSRGPPATRLLAEATICQYLHPDARKNAASDSSNTPSLSATPTAAGDLLQWECYVEGPKRDGYQ